MITLNDQQVQDAIAQLQREGKLPAGLSPQQQQLLARSLQKYSGEVSAALIQKITDDFAAKIKTASSAQTPDVLRGIIADLGSFVGSPEIAAGIKWSLDISQEVASGAGRFLNSNLSPEALDAYPAWELARMFQRHEPRGMRDPDDSWPARWAAAGGDFYGGRMIALKSDPVWQALGDGQGGYDDTLGNPFPPFAFNSGFMTYEISRKECEELGVLDSGDEVEPAPLNLAKLFAPVT